MEIDVNALQRLPEITEVVGLRPTGSRVPPKGGVRCCRPPTCKRTPVLVIA